MRTAGAAGAARAGAAGSGRARSRRGRLGLAALGASALLALAGPAAAVVPGPAPSYRNPVSGSFADTFADPSIIHAKDGWWYAYSTADPLRAGDPAGIMHIARTRDFVSWQYEGTVFHDDNRPSWATATSGLWAPDIRYSNGRYLLYYTVTDTTLNAGDDSAIGVATSPSPVGPWTPGDAPVVAPRPAPGGGFLWTFDPAELTDVHGQRYLYYGSYFGGLWATRLSADGLSTVGAATQVAIDNRYEGSYVVRHGGFYYLMASAANCCAGPTTGYSVFAGRSRSPLGPFVDADGIALLAPAVGGTVMLTQNGNRWVGSGHHAITTDDAGRDYVVYHAIDRHQPWLDQPFGVNRRPMLMDRIDWVDGWPRVRAGAGPSDGPQPAPVTGSLAGITPADPAAAGFRGLAEATDPQSGAAGRLHGHARTRAVVPAIPLQVRLDVKPTAPLRLALGHGSSKVSVVVDPVRRALRATTGAGRARRTEETRLGTVPSGWSTLTVRVGRGHVLAQLSESDLNDPLAEVRVAAPSRSGAAPLRLTSRAALVDNVSVAPLAVQASRPAPVPRHGRLLLNEDFDSPLSSSWSWVRQDAAARLSNGQLDWPVEGADLTGTSNDAGVLLHDTPTGDYIAQTRLTLDLGQSEVRNYQQAGLVVYAGDDDFARLSSVAIWDTRQTEFGRELVADDQGRTSYGGALVGTPAKTVWLRVAHTTDAAGEQLYRAATSRDGQQWTWGATWTFPAGAHPKIGLVSLGGATPAVTARFSYLRFYAIR